MKCIICGQPVKSYSIINSPISGYRCRSVSESLNEPKFNLSLQFCENCTFTFYPRYKEAFQVLDKLYSGHTSTYYNTPQLMNYLNNFVSNIIEKNKLCSQSKVLEIGCNDGKLLNKFRQLSGCEILGVEPSKMFSVTWKEYNLTVLNNYFDSDLVAKNLNNIKFDVITFRHVLEHIPDPLDFIKSVASIMYDRTLLVIEVPYFVSVIAKRRVENISYSHLNYFTIRSINEIISKFSLGIESVDLVETDGGSIVFYIRKNITTNASLLDNLRTAHLDEFLNYIDKSKERIQKLLSGYSQNEIVGYGAGAKGSHLLYLFNLHNYIKIIVDDTPGYENKYIPGTNVIIKSNSYLDNKELKAIINLAPTHSEAIKNSIPGHFKFINIIEGEN